MSLAKEVLAESHALVEKMLKQECSAAGVLLAQLEEKERNWPYGQPEWRRKYMQPDQPEPPGEE
jgi:hypothetical protein